MPWFQMPFPNYTLGLSSGNFVAAARYMELSGATASAVESAGKAYRLPDDFVPTETAWRPIDLHRAAGTPLVTPSQPRPLPVWSECGPVVVIGRNPSAAGWRERFPRPMVGIACNPGSLSGGVRYDFDPSEVDVATGIDATYWEHLHNGWLDRFAGPVFGPQGTATLYTGAGQYHPIPPQAHGQTMPTAVCYLTTHGVEDIILAGVFSEGTPDDGWQHRRDRITAVARWALERGTRVWRDGAGDWDFAPVWGTKWRERAATTSESTPVMGGELLGVK